MRKIQTYWNKFKEKHPTIAQFAVFFILSNGVTVLQLIMMPLFKAMLANTGLAGMNFQIGQIGRNLDGSPYYIFNYGAGAIADGGGGGLAYFLAVEITMAVAQIINFFAQRNVTFKSDGNIWKAAFWYVIAYIAITIGAAALQGIYKVPIYTFLMNKMGKSGETAADLITMIINCAVSFWVFFPIFKVIFRTRKDQA